MVKNDENGSLLITSYISIIVIHMKYWFEKYLSRKETTGMSTLIPQYLFSLIQSLFTFNLYWFAPIRILMINLWEAWPLLHFSINTIFYPLFYFVFFPLGTLNSCTGGTGKRSFLRGQLNSSFGSRYFVNCQSLFASVNTLYLLWYQFYKWIAHFLAFNRKQTKEKEDKNSGDILSVLFIKRSDFCWMNCADVDKCFCKLKQKIKNSLYNWRGKTLFPWFNHSLLFVKRNE